MSNWSALDATLAMKQELMQLMRKSTCKVQRCQGQTRTVVVMKLCMAAKGTRCLLFFMPNSWPFFTPAFALQQATQAVYVTTQ